MVSRVIAVAALCLSSGLGSTSVDAAMAVLPGIMPFPPPISSMIYRPALAPLLRGAIARVRNTVDNTIDAASDALLGTVAAVPLVTATPQKFAEQQMPPPIPQPPPPYYPPYQPPMPPPVMQLPPNDMSLPGAPLLGPPPYPEDPMMNANTADSNTSVFSQLASFLPLITGS